jgi:cadmium resistance protein CadD (predicted permease)
VTHPTNQPTYLSIDLLRSPGKVQIVRDPAYKYIHDKTMPNGNALLTACTTFAITNIDDLFILVTFFAEATTGKTLTPLTIVVGQYVGFSIVLAISMIGFGIAVVLPTEPIGFLGLLPVLLGFWSLLDLLVHTEDEGDDEVEVGVGGWKAMSKVAAVTVVNGGDNMGTYIPLFAQASKGEIAIYLVTYYILLGVWCGVAWLVMQQKDVLQLAEKYASFVVPFLYMALGVAIMVKSKCYPWLGGRIDAETEVSGLVVLALTTTAFLVLCAGGMVLFKLRQRRRPGEKSVTTYTEVAGDDDWGVDGGDQ